MGLITNIITVLSCLFIGAVFFYFITQARKILACNKLLTSVNESEDALEALKGSNLEDIGKLYQRSINIDTPDGKKTNMPSAEYFTDVNTFKAQNLNMKQLNTAAGTLVGLGLLGTFIGLTLGIALFDSSDTEHIQSSIQGLLAGMGTAFSTSLFGMTFSLIYTAYDKSWRNKLSRNLSLLTDTLDGKYFIDDISLMKLNQQELLNTVYHGISDLIEEQTGEVLADFKKHLTYNDENGNTVEVGNAVREMLTENQEQSKALKSFSTDLAIELNNGFDETLSRQMQSKLLPLMESVDNTTKSVVEHIDRMAVNVSSPATDMIQNVVETLQSSMSSVLEEFKKNISTSATNQLEKLAVSLGSATEAIGTFPSDMQNISDTMKMTINEVRDAVTEISNTSASSNSEAMKQMQEQITFATTSISNAISEVKDVMSNITKSSEQSSQEVMNKLSNAADEMGSFLNTTISKISESVSGSMKTITDNVADKQSDLIELQESSTNQTKELLEKFNEGLDKLEKMNEYVTGTMDMFQKAQGEITGSTAHLQAITGNLRVSTETFNKTQEQYSTKVAELQAYTNKSIDEVTKLLVDSGEMSSDYLEKFGTIKEGLASIFQQIQSGLTEYSRTVQATTQKYLDQYSASLTQTTDALASTISQQSEVVEMLNDTLSHRK